MNADLKYERNVDKTEVFQKNFAENNKTQSDLNNSKNNKRKICSSQEFTKDKKD